MEPRSLSQLNRFDGAKDGRDWDAGTSEAAGKATVTGANLVRDSEQLHCMFTHGVAGTPLGCEVGERGELDVWQWIWLASGGGNGGVHHVDPAFRLFP